MSEKRDVFKLFGVSGAEFDKRVGRLGIADAVTAQCDGLDLKAEFVYDEDLSRAYGDVERKFLTEFSKEIYAVRDVSLKVQLVDLLKINGATLSVAESFTGGGLASAIVSVAGASKVFYEGIVAYNERAKIERLGVKAATIEKYKPVSAQVAAEMARGLLASGRADVGVSTTGLAGPESDESGFPVGLCYIGVRYMGETAVYEYRFDGDRKTIIENGINAAIFRAIKFITR